MKMETYDVIDKHGNKIGEATWKEVHSEGLLHRQVHGILFSDNSLSKTLIKNRTPGQAQESSKKEIAVAGHVISGDTIETAMYRELEEELFENISFPKENIRLEKICTYFNNDFPNNNELANVFEIIYPGPFSIQKEEATDAFWMDWQELLTDIKKNPGSYAQFSINAINAYVKFKKKEL